METGSDNSEVFLDLYRKNNIDTDLILLDAVDIDTERKFDCIYSNKVLHHLTRDQLKQSFINQHEILNKKGILFHSFWYGTDEEEIHGLKFVYYTEETIKEIIENYFEILDLKKYKELEEDDSWQSDADGSVKVALIGMDRSIGAWGALREYFPEKADDILDILVHLDRLRRKAEHLFPNARNFIRPGFDTMEE